MNRLRWASLIVVSIGMLAIVSGCGMKKQVRYTSGPPNVAVSAEGLHQIPDANVTEYTSSDGTRYVQINNSTR